MRLRVVQVLALFDSRVIRQWPLPLAAALLAVAIGCDKSTTKPAPGDAQAGDASAAGADDAANEVADDAVRTPATVEEAAKVLDLRTFPLLPGVKDPPPRVVASIFYMAKGEVKAAYEFLRKGLLKRKFKELPQAYASVTDESASGQFTRNGFHVSLSVSTGSDPGTVTVALRNHSNVNLAKLPVPPDAKSQYVFPGVASFVTDVSVEDTAAAVRKLLLADGWQPYGSAGDSMHFKQNAVELNARVLAPPAQPGKTVIDYSTTQLSADLPAPPDAESVQYADQIKRVNIDAPSKPDDVIAYYRTTLAQSGWKATTENPIKDRNQQMLIFRNPGEEMLTLIVHEIDDKSRFSLQHQSREEIAELDRQIEQQIAAKQKQLDDERNRPKPKVAMALPEGADITDSSDHQIEFKVPSGQGKQAVAAIEKQLEADGWKSDHTVGDDMAGQATFKKDDLSVSILYVDPGVIPAQITISGLGVLLEQASEKDKPDADTP